jgi:DNA-binding NarL/FixJ family response regulator
VIALSKPLRVLPCLDASVQTHLIAVLRSTIGVEMLAIAAVSTLIYRALNDDPDAIVIATKDFGTVAGQNGDDLIEVLSSTPTVLLSGQIGPLVRKRAAALHIRSVLPLQVTSDQLLAAIQATVAGLAVTLEPLVQTEDAYAASGTADGIALTDRLAEHLTARETVVLRLMALGLGNKEIASRLDISEHTAKFHVSSILAKLGAASRTEAVSIGITRGVVAI